MSKEKFYICLTHDVDRTKKTYQYLSSAVSSLFKGEIKSFFYHVFSFLKKNPYWNFPKIISLEQKYGVKSTFFFLNESIPFKIFSPKNWPLSLGRYTIKDPKVQNIIRWLDQHGWEIGVHGSYNSFKNLELLQKEKEFLEGIVGHPIIGIRQHYLNLNYNTWSLQEKAGFLYDATLGSNNHVGFNSFYRPTFPFGSNKKFIIIQTAIMDKCLMKQENPYEVADALLEEAERNQAVLVLNWHNVVFNKKERQGFSEMYEYFLKEGKKRHAKFVTCAELYKRYIQ